MPTTKKEEKPAESTHKAVTLPGKDISTAGFAVAIASIFTNFFTLGLTAVAGLVLSIIGRIQSSKAGHPNPLALAGIIISGAVMALTFIAFIFFMMLVVLSNPRTMHRQDMRCGNDTSDIWTDGCQQPDNTDQMPRYPHNKS